MSGLLSLAVAVPLLLTGCGSSSSSGTVATDTAVTSETPATENSAAAASATEATVTASVPSGAPSAKQLKPLTDCLAENGVTLPEGGFGAVGGGSGAMPSLPAGVDPAAMQKALGACQDKLPAGLAGGLPGAGGAGGPDISAFTACLKDNGVAVPDNATPLQIPRDDPKFADASKTCEPLLPAGLLGARNATPTTVAG